jgi:ankyrin repeat protein
VVALIANGADVHLMNKRGSTPLHLAVQDTGRSNAGSDAAREQQRLVIGFLLQYGAGPTDVDANGKSVEAAASSEWIRQLLGKH